MASLSRSTSRRFDSPNLKGVAIFYNPFNPLAFLHLQGSGQGGRANQVKLPIIPTALNDLHL
jgi:hypothetical protein